MSVGEGAAPAQLLPIKPGRYLMPLARRLFLLAVAPYSFVYLILTWIVTSHPIAASQVVFAAVMCAVLVGLDAASWFVPVTVVDQWGIHRRIGRHRHIPWADVYDLHVVRTGRFAVLELELPSARSVGLLGVPISALRVTPDGPSSLDLFQPPRLEPSHAEDAADDPWRTPAS